MSLMNSASATFKKRVLPALPKPLQQLIEGGSRKQLLAGIERQLLLVDGELIDIATGHSCSVTWGEADIEVQDSISLWSKAIAESAASLVGADNFEGILLYLPPSEFVSTSISMPGVSKDNLLAALKLQAENLFPSFDQPLNLTLGGQSNDIPSSIALWFTEASTTELFKAFEKEKLFLVAVAPRNLIDSSSRAIVDYDSKGATLVELSGGSISSWLHINQLDLLNENLNQQWNDALAVQAKNKLLTFDGANSFKKLQHSKVPTEHCFITDGALRLSKKKEKKRNLALSTAAGVILLFLGAVPFIIQTFQFRTMAAELRVQREQSADARENRGVVVNFENDWGAITDFPIQEVQLAMFTLQNILQPDQLASLELSEGVIKIQGTSSEPQAILQRLEQDPMFTEVVFSRATNNSRYYIDLRLSTINFEGYMVRHFPDA